MALHGLIMLLTRWKMQRALARRKISSIRYYVSFIEIRQLMIHYECMRRVFSFLKVENIPKKGGGWQIVCIPWF